MSEDKLIGALLGFAVGDALGFPVNRVSREVLNKNPVVGLRSIQTRTLSAPIGTWSNQTSLVLCLTLALSEAGDLEGQLAKFGEYITRWDTKGYLTVLGHRLDGSSAVNGAVSQLAQGVSPRNTGFFHTLDSGSVAYALPVAISARTDSFEDRAQKIGTFSAVTHSHPECMNAAVLYGELVVRLFKGATPNEALYDVVEVVRNGYGKNSFSFLAKQDLQKTDRTIIHSGNHPPHVIEASLWALANSGSYKEAVLKAINLGECTEVIGALTGGLAGIVYGQSAIPKEWLDQLARRDDIAALACGLYQSIERKSAASGIVQP